MTTTAVLVHGMWYGAWCFDGVVARLAHRGIKARAVELSHSGRLDNDVAIVREAIDAADKPVVLLGHSYGGVVITEAGARNGVNHLIYLAAFMPAENETIRELVASTDDQPLRPGAGLTITTDGEVIVDPDQAASLLFADCSPEDTARAIARLCPEQLGEPRPPNTIAWRQIPSTYVSCTQDRALSHTLQGRFALQAETALRLPTSHSPFISQPDLVADLILNASDRLAGLAETP